MVMKKIVHVFSVALMMCATLAANAQEEEPGPFSQGVSLITAFVQQTIPILVPIAEALAPAAADTDEAIDVMMTGLGRKLLQIPVAPAPAAVEEETGGNEMDIVVDYGELETSPAPASVEKKEGDMVAPAPAEEMMMADKPDKKEEMPPVPPPQEEMMMADKPDKKEEMPPVPPPQEEMMMADKPDKKEEMPPVPPPQEEMMMADKKEEMSMPPVPPPQEEEVMTDMAGPVEGSTPREVGPIAEALRALGNAPIRNFFETLFNQTLPAIGAALATPPTVTPVVTTGGPTASG